MTITFFNNNSKVNTIEKKLINPYEIDGVFFKDPSSVENPTIILSLFDNWTKYNYVQIPVLNRYYFIAGFSILDGNRVEIQLRCDVLMSFKADILAATATISRSTSSNNSMISDTVTPPWISGNYTFKRFSPSEFIEVSAANNSFVLVTMGGGISNE